MMHASRAFPSCLLLSAVLALQVAPDVFQPTTSLGPALAHPAALQLERQQCAALRQQLQLLEQQAEEAQLVLEAQLHTQKRQILVAAARQEGLASCWVLLQAQMSALRCSCCPALSAFSCTTEQLAYSAHPAHAAGAAPGSRARPWPRCSGGMKMTCSAW